MTSWRIHTPGNPFNENCKDTGACESADIGSSIVRIMPDLRSSHSARENPSTRKWPAGLLRSVKEREGSRTESNPRPGPPARPPPRPSPRAQGATSPPRNARPGVSRRIRTVPQHSSSAPAKALRQERGASVSPAPATAAVVPAPQRQRRTATCTQHCQWNRVAAGTQWKAELKPHSNHSLHCRLPRLSR